MNQSGYAKRDATGKTISWYSTAESAIFQFNEDGVRYHYLALGTNGGSTGGGGNVPGGGGDPGDVNLDGYATEEYVQEQIAEIKTDGTDLFPEQDLLLTNNGEMFVYQALSDSPNYAYLHELEPGNEYKTLWGDREYACTAEDTSASFVGIPDVVVEKVVGMGNFSYSKGGADNGVPFFVEVYDLRTTDGGPYMRFAIVCEKNDSTAESLERKFHVWSDSSGKIKDNLIPSWVASKQYVDTAVGEALGYGSKTVTAVDLSRFDSAGIIKETYSDDTYTEYKITFDADGNPTKITDSNGNKTEMTW
jgi:YD repeat-containing protein